MRVTKIIKEYVEKSVVNRMPYPEKPDSTLPDEWSALLTDLQAACQNAICDFFESHAGECFPYYCRAGKENIEKTKEYVRNSMTFRIGESITLVSDLEYNEARKEIDKKRKEAIENILVSLELGANRAELEEMLSKIG